MSDYHHLRVDTPTMSYLEDHLKLVQDTYNPYEYYSVLEVSDTGKRHVHMIILLDPEDIQKLRVYLGTTFKRNLKKDHPQYWEKVYGDSKKIQVYSLKKVRNHNKCWAYIHKQANTDVIYTSQEPTFTKWRQGLYDECIKIEQQEELKGNNQEEKQIDEFWEKFLAEHPEWHEASISNHNLTSYLYSIQQFYKAFPDLKGFRAKYLKSAYKNGIIDWNVFVNKYYRL